MDEQTKLKLIADCQENVGPGWGDIIKRLIEDLLTLGWDGEVRQVKEKFGTLRFYTGKGDEMLWKRIGEAESESARTCEKCGAPGSLRGGGWMKTLCDEHHVNRGEARFIRK